MGSILEGKSYNFKLSVSEERKQGLVGLSLLYKTTSDRIKEGWSTSEFTKEDEEANLKGEYPAEQAE